MRFGGLSEVLFVLQERGGQGVERTLDVEGKCGDTEGVATRMLACPLCSKVFRGTKRKYRLDRHMLVHWGLKPFKCPHCLYRSTQQNNLNRHIKTVHPQQIGPLVETGGNFQANPSLPEGPIPVHYPEHQNLREYHQFKEHDDRHFKEHDEPIVL